MITIHSYQQFIYLNIRDYKIKINIYLLYSIRSKNETKTYSIHIHIYEKISFEYRASFLSSLKFTFLPVHLTTLQLNILCTNDNMDNCIDQKCIHGQCVQYFNSKHTFCQCQKGWSGKYSTISYECTCSSDSLCIGVLPNRSLHVCPVNKCDPQCFLRSMIGQLNENETFVNGGTWISTSKMLYLKINSYVFVRKDLVVIDVKSTDCIS